ncbi:hypothetical protein Pmar_PMAR023356, partial [Perkinsus marinus ATCC 50983]
PLLRRRPHHCRSPPIIVCIRELPHESQWRYLRRNDRTFGENGNQQWLWWPNTQTYRGRPEDRPIGAR